MTPKKIIRKKVLEALKMAEGFGKPFSMVRELVGDLCGEDPGIQNLRDEMDALHSDEMIRSEMDPDDDKVVLWYLTPKGAAKLKTL